MSEFDNFSRNSVLVICTLTVADPDSIVRVGPGMIGGGGGQDRVLSTGPMLPQIRH